MERGLIAPLSAYCSLEIFSLHSRKFSRYILVRLFTAFALVMQRIIHTAGASTEIDGKQYLPLGEEPRT